MSLNTNASTTSSQQRRTGLKLPDDLIDRNRETAQRFVQLSRKKDDSAERFYNSLPQEVQEYVRYSHISERPYLQMIRRCAG